MRQKLRTKSSRASRAAALVHRAQPRVTTRSRRRLKPRYLPAAAGGSNPALRR
jgi:hypothetical protein